MIPCTRQRQGRTVARPRTGEMPIQHFRGPDEDWADLDTASSGERPEVVRELVRWYLRRPGARLPERPALQDWAAIREAAALDWFRGFGHEVEADRFETGDDGQQWPCAHCDSHLSITSKGKAKSSSGTARCPGPQS